MNYMAITYDRTMINNQLERSINKIQDVFPEYSYEKLKHMFYEKLTDKQIAYFRHLWHAWRVDNVEGQEQLVKDFLKINI